MFVGFHVRCLLFLSVFHENGNFSTDFFGKSSNVKFHENLTSGNGVVLCEHTDVMMLIVAFRNFVNAPGKKCVYASYVRKTISNTDLKKKLFVYSQCYFTGIFLKSR